MTRDVGVCRCVACVHLDLSVKARFEDKGRMVNVYAHRMKDVPFFSAMDAIS